MPGFTTFRRYEPGSSVENAALPVPFPDVESRTRIASRRAAWPKETVPEMGVEVVRRLRDALGIKMKECGGIVLSTCASDPAVHARELAKLACAPSDAEVAGVNAACTGFVAATERALPISQRTGRPVFVVASEKMTDLVDYRDEATAILFGDFAAGSVIAQDGRHRILDAFSRVVPDEKRLLGRTYVPDALGIRGSPSRRICVSMPGGKDLYRTVPAAMLRLIDEGLSRAGGGLGRDHVGLVVPHQANGKILERLEEVMRTTGWVSPPPEVINRIHRMGNVGSAGIPAAYSMLEEEQSRLLFPDALVASPALGAGPDLEWGALTEGNLLVRWDSSDKA